MRYRIAASPTETCQHYFALKPREGERREVERKIAVSAQEVFCPPGLDVWGRVRPVCAGLCAQNYL